MKKRFVAFSLAETLVVLVFIGVLSAMLIPALISSYQKQATVARLQKVYSVLQQGVLKLIMEVMLYNLLIPTWYII